MPGNQTILRKCPHCRSYIYGPQVRGSVACPCCATLCEPTRSRSWLAVAVLLGVLLLAVLLEVFR